MPVPRSAPGLCRELTPDGCHTDQIQVRYHDARSVRRLGNDDPPRVYDHAAAVGWDAGADAALSRGDHEGPVLNGPCPQQHLPVVPAGGFGEVGRHRQNFRPSGSQLTI